MLRKKKKPLIHRKISHLYKSNPILTQKTEKLWLRSRSQPRLGDLMNLLLGASLVTVFQTCFPQPALVSSLISIYQYPHRNAGWISQQHSTVQLWGCCSAFSPPAWCFCFCSYSFSTTLKCSSCVLSRVRSSVSHAIEGNCKKQIGNFKN